MDRIRDWNKFSSYMSTEYLGRTVDKYGAVEGCIDLMTFTGKRECLFSILKYAIRLWNGHGKRHDWEKMAHYAQIGWTKLQHEINYDNQTLASNDRIEEDKHYKGQQ